MSDNSTSIGREKRLYYSSSRGPFHNASSIHLFYGGGDRGAIVDEIRRSLQSDGRLRIVRGERGSGKTMLSFVLADRLRHRFNIIRYDHQRLSRSSILRHLLIELCPQDADLISCEQAAEGAGNEAMERAEQRLNSVLLAPPPAGKPFVLLVDSPVDTDADTLSLLRRLSTVRRDECAAMHVICFQRCESGTHRAAEAMNASGRSQAVDDGATVESGTSVDQLYTLRRLTLSEIHEYLDHHMLLHDFTRRNTFTREMVYFIAARSEGVFRAINVLARNAFTIASLESADTLSMPHLLMAGLPARHEKSPSVNPLRRHRRVVIALCGSCVVVSIAAMVLLL